MDFTPQPNAAPGIKVPKNESIETLRGLAILLIVMGHVIGIDAAGGMKVADDSIWRYLYVSTQYLCLPIFTAISGWVYAIRPAQSGQLGSSLLKKALRLLVPMACVGTLYFLVQYVTPGTNQKEALSAIWQIYVLPYTVYWYLPALFLMFAFVILLDSRGVCSSVRAWFGWMLFACALVGAEVILSENLFNVFSIWGAMALMPYFLLGVGLKRFPELITPGLKKLLFVGFCICVLAQQIMWLRFDMRVTEYVWPLRLLVGIVVAMFLLTYKWHSRSLIWIGSYAYGIYLFHAFGTSGGRILLKHAGIDSSVAIFALSMVLGVGMPILVEILLRRFPLLRTLFLGDKFRKEKKSA